MKVLDILKEYDIKATFFVIGKSGDYEKNLYQRIVDEGHTLGNHTYSHNYKEIYSSEENFLRDFKKLEDYIHQLTGVKMEIMRFPGGSNNTMSHKYSDDKFMRRITTKILYDGYQYFDWNVDSKDAKAVKQDRDIIINTVLEGARNNNPAIVLFHDSSPKTSTVEALPFIIEELIKEGYTFDVLNKDSFYVQFKK